MGLPITNVHTDRRWYTLNEVAALQPEDAVSGGADRTPVSPVT
jgi:hypothetical protein